MLGPFELDGWVSSPISMSMSPSCSFGSVSCVVLFRCFALRSLLSPLACDAVLLAAKVGTCCTNSNFVLLIPAFI